MDETQTPDEFAKISAEEAERRRVHVRVAIADSRIEGMPPPSAWELEIWKAYIRGEIEAKDLMDVIKKGLLKRDEMDEHPAPDRRRAGNLPDRAVGDGLAASRWGNGSL